jgi:hypothetical protein
VSWPAVSAAKPDEEQKLENSMLRKMIWEAVASEMEADTPFVGPTFTADDIVATVWEWNSTALEAAGIRREDVRPGVLEVLDHIEAHGWNVVGEEFQRGRDTRNPASEAEITTHPPIRPVDSDDLPF